MIHHFSVIDSTNSEALRRAGNGASHGTVVSADTQTAGRGRGGRTFISPRGGLYFSVIIRPKISIQDLALITLAAGVGVCRGLSPYTSSLIQLKWPNDLFIEGKKLGGILTEAGPMTGGTGPEYLVVGVGINMQTNPGLFPESLRSRVCSLYHVHAGSVESAPLLQKLVQAMLVAVTRLESDREGVLADWQNRDYLLGKGLEYESSEGVVRATGKGLALDGRYIILDEHFVEHRVVAGDLHPISLHPDD